MKEIDIKSAQKLSSPNPFALVTSLKDNGETNVMALSWWTYISNNPASIAVSISNHGYSGELILKNKTFGLSIVGEALADKAFLTGTCSGRNISKAEKFDIPMFEIENFNTKLISGSKICFACELVSTQIIGDHTLYIGKIIKIFGNDAISSLYAFDGYAHLKPISLPR